MKLSKNRKKQWRKCLPGIDEEIVKCNELKEIERLSFDLGVNQKSKQLKYSTVPRPIVRKIKKQKQNKYEATDIWADESKPESCEFLVLDKNKKKNVETRKRIEKPGPIIHPGMLWNPDKDAHTELLHLLQQDEMLKSAVQNKYLTKDKTVIATDSITPTIDDEENAENQDISDPISETVKPKTVPQPVTTKQRRQRLVKKLLEKQRTTQRTLEREQAHQLNNLPRINKQLKKAAAAEPKKTRQRDAQEARQKAKTERDSRRFISVDLPHEMAPSLREMTFDDIDLVGEMTCRIAPHLFRGEKRTRASHLKTTRKFKKTFKKNGLK